MLNQNDMKNIHEIISTIYCAKTITSMRRNFMKALAKLIDFDMAIFDMGKTVNSTPITTDSIIESKFNKLEENKFLSFYETTFSSLDYIKWIFSNSESMVYRTSDLINDAYRKKSSFYLDFLQQFNLDYASGIVIINNSRFLATLTLFKVGSKGDFSDMDILILKQFLPHLQSRFVNEDNLLHEQNKNGSFILKNQYKLTNREIEIMGCIYRGCKNDEIAEMLSIAPTTVKKHITNLYSKLEITSRSELMRFILNNNLSSLCEYL